MYESFFEWSIHPLSVISQLRMLMYGKEASNRKQ